MCVDTRRGGPPFGAQLRYPLRQRRGAFSAASSVGKTEVSGGRGPLTCALSILLWRATDIRARPSSACVRDCKLLPPAKVFSHTRRSPHGVVGATVRGTPAASHL